MDELSLHIKVKGLSDLDRLKRVVNDLRKLKVDKDPLAGTKKSVDQTADAIRSLEKTFTAGMSSIVLEVRKLAGSLSQVNRAAQTAGDSIEKALSKKSAKAVTETKKRAKALDDEAKSLNEVAARYQELYDKQLRGPEESRRSTLSSNRLARYRSLGVGLTPRDLARMKDEIDLVKERAKVWREVAKSEAATKSMISPRGVGRRDTLTEGSLRDLAEYYRAIEAEDRKHQQRRMNAAVAATKQRIRALRDIAKSEAATKAMISPAGVGGRDTLTEGSLRDMAAHYRAIEAEDRKRSLAMQKAAQEASRLREKELAEQARAAEKAARAREKQLAEEERAAKRTAQLRARELAQVQRTTQELARLRERELASEARFVAEKVSLAARLAAVEKAHAYIGLGGDVDKARRRWGTSAVNIALNPTEMNRLRGEVEGANSAITRHGAGIMRLDREYQTLHTSVRGLAGGLGGLWLSYGRPMAALWAGFATAAGIRSSFAQLREFSQQMSVVNAVSGESANSIQELSRATIELGRTGRFSAIEYASALRTLSQAGLSAKDALKQLPAVTNLAIVGELPLNKAAESLVGITTAFGLAISDMPIVADKMGKAAAISQASIESLTGSMRVASAVAEQYNVDIDTTLGILSVLAKRNITGTQAGTSIRNMFRELQAPLERARTTLEGMGVEVFDKLTGRSRLAVEIFKDLEKAMAGMNAQSRAANLDVIFGERGGKASSAILADVKEFMNATQAIKDAPGFLALAGAQVQQSIDNQWLKAVNNLKNAFLGAGTESEAAIRRILTTISDLVSSDGFVRGVASLTKAIATLVEGFIEAGRTIGTIFVAVVAGKLLTALASAGNAALLAASRLLQFRGAVVALSAGGAMSTLTAVKTQMGLIGASTAAAGAGVTAVAGTLGKLAAAGTRFIPIVGQIVTVVGLLTGAFALLQGTAQAAGSKDKTFLDIQIDAVEEAVKRAEETLANMADRKRLGVDLTPQGFGVARSLDEERERRADLESKRATILRGIADAEERIRKVRSGENRLLRPDMLYEAVDAASELKKALKLIDEQLADSNARIDRGEKLYGRLVKASKKLQGTFEGNEDDRLKALYETYGVGKSHPRIRELSEFLDPFIPLRRGKEKFERDLRELSDKTASAIKDIRLLRDMDHPTMGEDQYNQGVLGISEAALAKEEALLRRHLGFINTEYANLVDKTNKSMHLDTDALARELVQLEASRVADVEAVLERIRQVRYRREDATREGKLHEARELAKREAAEMKQWLAGFQGEMDFEKRGLDANKANIEALASLGEQTFLKLEEQRYSKRNAMASAKDAEMMQGQLEIRRRFSGEMLKAQKEFDETSNRDMLDRTQQALQQALNAHRQYVEERHAFESSAGENAIIGLRNYANEADRWGQSIQQSLTGAFRSAGDAFADFVVNGRQSFSGLVDAMIADLARLTFQKAVLGPIADALANFFTVSGPSPSSPAGGAMAASGLQGFIRHSGGIVGKSGASRIISAGHFYGAPRYHSGGIVNGEVPIIARKGEGVFTESQMRALAPVGAAPNVKIEIINNGEPLKVTQQTSRSEGRDYIISAVVEDISRNGKVAQALRRR